MTERQGEKIDSLTEETRSIWRLVLGIFSIGLGIISLYVSFHGPLSPIGAFYGLVFIVIGVILIRQRKENRGKEIP